MVEDEKLCVSKSWKRRLVKILSLFHNPTINNVPTNRCIKDIQRTMKAEYVNYWKTVIGDPESNEGRLYIYRKVKSGFRMEPYLRNIKQFKVRRAMSVFRISNHKLEIETGRYRDRKNKDYRIPHDDRICTL